MMDSILILGRQPALGRAELESLYGAPALTSVASNIVQLKHDPVAVDFNRLGGSVKLAKLLSVRPTTNWPQIVKYLTDTLPQHLQYLPEGKLKLGLSVYELPAVKPADINRAALSLKRVCTQAGRSTRVVPNQSPTLNSAQVLHNQLTGPLGMELLLIGHGKQTLLAQTIAEQDIEAYAARDQARPKRDAKVGMLPPKLAQIIVNLARPQTEGTILDPFCGTGVVLQEALLMGFAAYGSDLDERMVEFAQENVVNWLLNSDDTRVSIEHGDATTYTWQSPFEAVASEVYLGQPFSALPHPDKLHEVIQNCNTITKKFLQNLATQTPAGFRLCLAVPAWKTDSGFKHLPTLDKLSDMGYNRLSFVHARASELIYHRPEQIVARELITLIRK